MRSPTFLLAFALGLLPSLTVAGHCSNDDVAIERLPVFATSDGPFNLRIGEEYSVVLKYQAPLKVYVPVLSKKKDGLPEFLLTHGNLTSDDERFAGFYPPGASSSLKPLLFSSEVHGKDGADIVIVTKDRPDGSGREIRRLFPLNGPAVVKKKEEGAEIYIKPDGNSDSTVQVDLDLRRPPGYNGKACADNQLYLNNWDLK